MKNEGIQKECFYFCLFVNIDLIPKFAMKKIMSIIAAVLVFFGFGMIHSPSPIVERLGSMLIGIGSLWLIIVLIKSIKKSQKSQSTET